MKVIQKNWKKLLALLTAAFIIAGCSSLGLGQKEETKTEQAQVQTVESDFKWDESIKIGELSNGMKYYVKNNKKPENRISLRLIVRAGSNMEEDDQKGLAHFIEHLCFNGTKNFAKSAIVDYFESIGMKFGPEVNAYTSFEETVYKLELPADDPEMLKTGLLVLHDWASAVSFEQEEIEKERGVIIEEWRGNLGLQGRLSDSQLEFLLKKSKFAQRKPIGDMDVIRTISRERILDFYKKHYVPENMAIVAVGDADISVLEKEIQDILGEIPASKTKYERESFRVPTQRGKNLCVFTDPEIKFTLINIFFRKPDFKPALTEKELKEDLAMSAATMIFNQRLREITNSKDSTWLDAGFGDLSLTNKTLFYYAGIAPKDDKFEEALKKLLDETDRFVEYGIVESELERIKKSMLSSQEKNYKNKDKTYSTKHADSIVQADLLNDIVISPDDVYQLCERLIPEITVEEVNQLIKKKLKNRGELMYVMSSKDVLPEEQIKEIWKNYKNTEITKYTEEDTDEELMTKPAKKAKIISQKEIKEYDAKEYVLENGVKIIVKKTDNEKDTIRFKAVSYGGSNVLSEKDYPSSYISVDYAIHSGFKNLTYNQLMKKISTKQVSFSGFINSLTEGFRGSSTNGDFATLAQMVNLMFTSVNFNDEGWNIVYDDYSTTAKAHGKQPLDAFIDKINDTLFQGDIRYKSMDEEMLKKMNRKTAERIYKERFADISDFTFYFVGDIDEKNLIDNCRYYIGTIPSKNKSENPEYIKINYPEKTKEETVYKGIDEQGYLFIGFGGNIGSASDAKEIYKDEQLINSLAELLTIRLREVIREDKGGSYSVSVYGNIENSPDRTYLVQIIFGCEPAREEELKNEVLNQIKILKKELVSDEYITKLSESYKRSREDNLKNNSWILETLIDASFYHYVPENILTDDQDITKYITKENLKKLANKYLNTDKYICVFLKPEK